MAVRWTDFTTPSSAVWNQTSSSCIVLIRIHLAAMSVRKKVRKQFTFSTKLVVSTERTSCRRRLRKPLAYCGQNDHGLYFVLNQAVSVNWKPKPAFPNALHPHGDLWYMCWISNAEKFNHNVKLWFQQQHTWCCVHIWTDQSVFRNWVPLAVAPWRARIPVPVLDILDSGDVHPFSGSDLISAMNYCTEENTYTPIQESTQQNVVMYM